MEILAAPPLRAGSIVWQEQPDQWTLTVVCKATYALAPGTSTLAPEPEDVNERDNHWDDDPRRSLYAPSDLAPIKPRPEVMLVGSAFAPKGAPVRSLLVRVVVGELDKSIAVFGARTWLPDGTLRDGPRWMKMPIRYERAAGGAESWNPVGQSLDAADAYGRRALPNLQPPDLTVNDAVQTIAPVGFGPLASSWRARREKLRGLAEGWSEDRWTEAPLGADFDGAFFQAAPLDQRIEELRADERIILENLHPEHARLVTRLPGLRPRARVEMADVPPWDLTLLADTLWIDTDRAICTLTWRGQAPLDDRYQAGRVRIGVAETGQPVRWPPSRPPPAPSRRPPPEPPPPRDDELIHTAVDDAALVELLAEREKPVLPFQSAPRLDGQARSALPPKQASPSSPALVGAWPVHDEGTEGAISAQHARAPSWLDIAQPTTAPPAMHPPPLPQSAPPPPPPLRERSITLGQAAAYGGVLEASNAAAGTLEVQGGSRAETTGSTSYAPRPLIEVLWYDAGKIARVRQNEAWALLVKPPSHPEDPPPDDPEAAEKRVRGERADVASVLARALPTVDLDAAINEAAGEDGAVDPPLVMVAGELELPFDDARMLEILLGAAAPLAAVDKKLKDVLDLAAEVMKTPLGASPEVASGFCGRVREAWGKANRSLPADYLDGHTRRILLDQRAYQRRVLCDEEWIRALLTLPGESAAVPAYLPAALARRLPLFARFPARILAEAVPQQDQYEGHPCALRALALARVVPARSRFR